MAKNPGGLVTGRGAVRAIDRHCRHRLVASIKGLVRRSFA